MKREDLESLAAMLDKDAALQRPAGQTTGYSLVQEKPGGAVGGANQDDGAANGTSNAGSSVAVPLPSTVVDQQLRLPVPSHSAQAARMREAAQKREQLRRRPVGNDVWSQEELKERYEAQQRSGPAPVAALARGAARAAATVPTARPPGAEEPEHTVLYQQSVTAEDAYLGVDFTRDSSSAASDGVVVRIELPKTQRLADIAIRVEPFHLYVTAPGYYLHVPLPRKVFENEANARWDDIQKQLTVRLAADTSDDAVKIL